MEYEPPPAFSRPEDRTGPSLPAAPYAGGPDPTLWGERTAPWSEGTASWGEGTASWGEGAQPGGTRPLSTTGTIIAIAAVVVAALVVVGLVVLVRTNGGHEPARRVSLPDSAGDYQLIRSVDGKTAAAMLGSQLGSLGSISDAISTAQIGVYGTGGGPTALPTVVFLGFNRADSSTIGDLLASGSATNVARDVLGGAGSEAPSSFDPGPFGGALDCARARRNATAYTPCVWVDRSTLALVLRIGDVDTGTAAEMTRQFRAAAEH